MLTTVETSFRVRYAETDQMGIVYHANYLIWMEIGRVEYCRASGLNYRDLERDDGVLLIVAEANCRYIAPAHYDEEIVVRTTVAKAHPRMLSFSYEIVEKSSGRRLATGKTQHVFCDREYRPVKLPAKHRGVFGIIA
jgi:acyl-CoA thioester hydrolase